MEKYLDKYLNLKMLKSLYIIVLAPVKYTFYHKIHLKQGLGAIIIHLKCSLVNFDIPNKFLYSKMIFG